MKLTDEHIEILKKARTLIENETQIFICGAVFQFTLDENHPIAKAISKALGPRHMALGEFVKDYVNMDKDYYFNHRVMMRMAWIDRMIDLREIK